MPDNPTHASPQADLTPRQIVELLDRYIVGQQAAKRAVSIAIRNRWRRQQLPSSFRDEVSPKNIIMIGPTGVGKTEIARRLASLTSAPFVKVEASKFTEVGYVGRDVESIIRELTEAGIALVRREAMEGVNERAQFLAEDRLLDLLLKQQEKEQERTRVHQKRPSSDEPSASSQAASAANGIPPGLQQMMQSMLGAAFPGMQNQPGAASDTSGAAGASDAQAGSSAHTPSVPASPEERQRLRDRMKATLRQQLHKGELDTVEIEIGVTDSPNVEIMGLGMDQMGVDLQSMFERMVPQKSRQRRLRIPEAMKVLRSQEAEKLIDREKVTAEGVRRVEQSGIVFLDEIDKVIGADVDSGSGQPPISREGVQRDLLPIVEGSAVNTKHGSVRTDHILFIAAGAFHHASPSDLMPELQGRFPVRVQLEDLSRENLKQILTEPQNALIKQYVALMKTDLIDLVFTDDGIDEIARIAEMVNERHENIGARRLQTILERLLDDIAFEAPDVGAREFTLDRETVFLKLAGIIDDEDLSRYAL